MKTDDRELLELAAKAAGIKCDSEGPYVERPVMQSEFGKGNWIENIRFNWNPLEDDGDALRLAVKLDMIIGSRMSSPPWPREETCWEVITEPFLECTRVAKAADHCASLRRAIVRAAAEIGRAMK